MNKKTILSFVMAGLFTFSVFAEQVTIKIDYRRLRNSGSIGGGGDRAPIRVPDLPIDVTVDNETGEINVVAPDNESGCIYIYDLDGTQEAYSPTLNASFTLTQTGDIHIISLQGGTWIGEAKITY